MDFPVRLNKYLADRGYATRRGADALIKAGHVLINNKPASLGQKVNEHDEVTVRSLQPTAEGQSKFRYLLYYKPRGVLTHAEEGHEADALLAYIKKKNGITGLFPIGRLDKDTEGLIVLTNDGRLTRRLLEPEFGIDQEYEVTVDKRVTGTFLNRMAKGVRLESYTTKPTKVALGTNDRTFLITLSEGRKHHIRRMCATLGYAVTGLKRIRIGLLSLRALKPGTFHELTSRESAALHTKLGIR